MFLKERCLALGRTSRARPMRTEHLKVQGWKLCSPPLLKKAPCGLCSQHLKCYSDVTSSNELLLAETPPGGLCATTNTSVIAALKRRSLNDLFEQVCTAARFSPFVLQKNSAFAGPVNILLLDLLHRELKAKLRKQDRAAIEQVVWLRTSWQARRHGDEIRPFQTGVIPPAKVLDHIIIITVHQLCELLEHYTYFSS